MVYSGKIFTLTLDFAAVFPYIDQCLQLVEAVRVICRCYCQRIKAYVKH